MLSIDNLTTVREQTVSTGHCLSWNRFFKPEICYGHTVLLCLLQQKIVYLGIDFSNQKYVMVILSYYVYCKGIKVQPFWGFFFKQEEFEDTKGTIRIHISKNRQHNDQKKKYKRINNDLQNIHIKLKIE